MSSDFPVSRLMAKAEDKTSLFYVSPTLKQLIACNQTMVNVSIIHSFTQPAVVFLSQEFHMLCSMLSIFVGFCAVLIILRCIPFLCVSFSTLTLAAIKHAPVIANNPLL